MNSRNIIFSVVCFMLVFSFITKDASAATASVTQQKITVLSPSGTGGTESFIRGEKIPYSWTQTKNSKKLEVSLYGGPENKTVYKEKKYDGWGTNKKVISAKETAKLEPGEYMLTICDYTESKTDPVCDSSDGIITITSDTALEVIAKEEKDQKIEIKSPNGGEYLYRGEGLNYNYKLAKNTKNLLVELVDADKNTVVYSANRYDSWGDNRKVISKEATKNIPASMYRLRICDTTTKVPVCDSSDDRFTITDRRLILEILTPVLTKVQAKAADDNEVFASEEWVTLYGQNINVNTKVFMSVGDSYVDFRTQWSQDGSIKFFIPKKPSKEYQIPDGKYALYAMNGNNKSNILTIAYKNSATGSPTFIYFKSSKENILTGQSAVLSWDVSNVNRCIIQYLDKEESISPKGTKTVYPAVTTSYKIWCTNDPGTGKDGPAVDKTLEVKVSNSNQVPTIKVLSPNGGETLIMGGTYNINWKAEGVTKFDIILDARWERGGPDLVIAKGVQGDTFNWAVPKNLVSSDAPYSAGQTREEYKIMIVDANGIKELTGDYSDNYFSIKSVNPNTTDPDPSDDTYGDSQEQESEIETRTEEAGDTTETTNIIPTIRTQPDMCKNIDGIQTTMPAGYTNVGVAVSGNCKKIEPKKIKVCQVFKDIKGDATNKEKWKDVKCDGDLYKNATPKNKRFIERVEHANQSAYESVYSSTDLEMGMAHADVIPLQKFLNANGYIIESIQGEPGSTGYETNYFGEKTKQALIKYQKDKGIVPARGFFGRVTREAMGI